MDVIHYTSLQGGYEGLQMNLFLRESEAHYSLL